MGGGALSLSAIYTINCDECLCEVSNGFSERGVEHDALRDGWEKYVDKDGFECHRCPMCVVKVKPQVEAP